MEGYQNINFSGIWRLDLTNSESLEPHLDVLGLSELARYAASQMEITLSIHHDPSMGTMSITHSSALGEKVRNFVFGQELREVQKDGTLVRYFVKPLENPGEIETTIFWGDKRVTETKRLHGNVFFQEMVMMTEEGYVTKTVRRFVRVHD